MSSRLARAGVVGAMAAGAVVAITSIGAPGGAQAVATTAIEHPGFDFAPAVSDDGQTVVFVSTVESSGETSSLVLHDRGPTDTDGSVLPATTTAIADTLGAVNATISGDGCIIVWAIPAVIEEAAPDPDPDPEPAPPVDDGEPPAEETPADEDPADETAPPEETVPEPVVAAPARLVALDRCADPAGQPDGIRVDVPVGAGDLAFGPPAASVDGSVIAVSNGNDVVVFSGTPQTGYVETTRVDGDDTDDAAHLVGERVDVSDDGSVVVFSGGTDLADTSLMTVFAYVADGAASATTPVLAGATAPTISGDGATVAASTGATGTSVAVVDRTASPLVAVDLGEGGRPSISADGNHVVFEEGAGLVVVSRTGTGADAFATTQRTPLSTTVAPTRSGPVIDRFGTTVVSDFPVEPSSENTDVSVTVVDADASFDAALFDLGTGDVGDTLSTTVTFSNQGPASVGVVSLEVDGSFTITDDRCGAVIRPGTTCELDIAFTIERLEDAFGTVSLSPASFGASVFTAEVTALGVAAPLPTTTAPPTTPATTTTTTAPTTTGGTTTGGTTTGSTAGGSSSSATTTTTTTLVPGAGVVASPTTFDFAPTIVDAGRRTGLVEIVNNGTSAATIVGVRLDPAEAGPFQIVETTCAGETLAVGERCTVTLSFAPTETGTQSVSLIASIDGGADITVAVNGTGASAPTLDIVPGVATIGQVVTLSGSGFPTGITVELTWASTVTEVVVDDAGTFNVPVVVMSHTATGPASASVEGQTDMFATAAGTLIVTDTTGRSGPLPLDGVGVNIGR